MSLSYLSLYAFDTILFRILGHTAFMSRGSRSANFRPCHICSLGVLPQMTISVERPLMKLAESLLLVSKVKITSHKS